MKAMTVVDLIEKLRTILKVHMEARDSEVWVVKGRGKSVHVNYVRYDKHHKPHRIVLEE